MVTVAAATEAAVSGRLSTERPTGRRSGRTGPDRVSVMLFSLAAVLAVLALLAIQIRSGPSQTQARPLVVLRRIYRTTIVETLPGPGRGTSVSQSASSSGAVQAVSAAPTTRSSH
jgi:hypothetical protein